ncbi:hypothetical protein LEMLEM_LOCUS1656 [Lemmus lemmus]
MRPRVALLTVLTRLTRPRVALLTVLTRLTRFFRILSSSFPTPNPFLNSLNSHVVQARLELIILLPQPPAY